MSDLDVHQGLSEKERKSQILNVYSEGDQLLILDQVAAPLTFDIDDLDPTKPDPEPAEQISDDEGRAFEKFLTLTMEFLTHSQSPGVKERARGHLCRFVPAHVYDFFVDEGYAVSNIHTALFESSLLSQVDSQSPEQTEFHSALREEIMGRDGNDELGTPEHQALHEQGYVDLDGRLTPQGECMLKAMDVVYGISRGACCYNVGKSAAYDRGPTQGYSGPSRGPARVLS